jgi:hypothetical protein
LALSRRPRLADWGEYAAGVYEALGWGAEQFLEDWDGVVKVQNQGTLDGSPVAQTILSFMEDRGEYAGPASDLHAKLGNQAEEINIDVKRERSWPKTPSWLWRRMREVLPLLVAMGIEANNSGNTNRGSIITLTRTPTGDGPEGSSKNEDATPDATPAENHGHSSPSLSRTTEEKGEKQAENGGREQGLAVDATPATLATPAPPEGSETNSPNSQTHRDPEGWAPDAGEDLEGLEDLFGEDQGGSK